MLRPLQRIECAGLYFPHCFHACVSAAFLQSLCNKTPQTIKSGILGCSIRPEKPWSDWLLHPKTTANIIMFLFLEDAQCAGGFTLLSVAVFRCTSPPLTALNLIHFSCAGGFECLRMCCSCRCRVLWPLYNQQRPLIFSLDVCSTPPINQTCDLCRNKLMALKNKSAGWFNRDTHGSGFMITVFVLQD